MSSQPKLHELLPHKAPMILLDTLIDVGDLHVHCQATSSESSLFFDKSINGIPGWVGIELMAQSVAAWSGYQASKENKAPPIGFLLGSRRYKCDAPSFPRGTLLDVRANRVMESNGMAVFACTIEQGGKEIASAQLNAYVPSEEKLQQMLKGTPQ
ncbi:hotdog family protein [Grimontia sp. NTOU-MAR1]|uniref:hotdog family protein n=1 Tax=Grimontia sp. NTOU-MAR1 TaxID=3111011 RepID=UPI002DBC31E2|nr:hotdog family protein [Grimontia sp. NTOU-MAR1]WRV97168.1 hotdog family protein [Grimontia sp. NTOU-MAR1]